MSPPLEIASLRISRHQLPKAGLRVVDDRDASVTFLARNVSDKVTAYVATSLRTINYDETSRTLILSTADSGKELPGKPAMFVQPVVKPLLPGEQLEIVIRFATTYSQMVRCEGRGLLTKRIDTSSTQSVRIKIAWSVTAFRPVPNESPEEARKHFQLWAQLFEHEFKQSISDAPLPNLRPDK